MSNGNTSGLPAELRFYFSSVVMPCGIILNVFSAFVFFKRSLNSVSTNMGLLYGCLCVMNACSLVNLLTFNVLEYSHFPYDSTNVLCKWNMFWTKIVVHLPSYQQALIAFFMWLSITYPFKYKALIGKTLYFNAGIVGFLIATNATNFGYYMMSDTSTQFLNLSQTLVCSAMNRLDYASDCIHILNSAIVPCVLIFAFNTLSVRHMGKRDKKFKTMACKSQNFVRAVIGMNLMFLAIYLPWGVIFLTHHTFNFVGDDANSLSPGDFVNTFTFQVVYAASDCISYFNNVSPFFLSLMYNSLFRREIRILFTRRRDSLNVRQITYIQSLGMALHMITPTVKLTG